MDPRVIGLVGVNQNFTAAALAQKISTASLESGVRKISGVTGITNFITIKARVQAGDVKQKIQDALKRSAEMEANAIRITVTDSGVRLEGRVNDWREREIVEKAAWSVPGVMAVDDRLTV